MTRSSRRLAAAVLGCLLGAAPVFAQAPSSAAFSDAFMREHLACAPMSVPLAPAGTVRIIGGYVHGQWLFGPDTPVVLSGGKADGLRAGQQYLVRRVEHDPLTDSTGAVQPASIHTAGWVTIVDVKDTVSIATVTHACEGILEGDYLEPYTEPVIPAAASVTGAPDFEHPAEIIMGDERHQMAATGDLVVINRGAESGWRPGQTLTIYRPVAGGAASLTVGHATVMTVREHTAVIRIDSASEAVYVGDYAAAHRIQ